MNHPIRSHLPDYGSTAPRPQLAEVYQALVDPRYGIIRQVFESCQTAEFPQLHVAAARLSNPVYFRNNEVPPIVVPVSGAGAGITREQCLWATIGESVERYCSSIYHPESVYYAEADELEGAVFPLDDLILYSERQYAHPSFPFVRLDQASGFHWCAARNLLDGTPVHVPAHLVYFGLVSNPDEVLTLTFSTGAACGASYFDAISGGLREIIERDVFVSMWLLKFQPRQVQIDPAFAAQLSEGVNALLNSELHKITLWHLPSEFGAVVILACVEGVHSYRMALGAACHYSLAAACEKAIVEACHTWSWSKRFPDDAPAQAKASLGKYGGTADSKTHVSYYLTPDSRADIAFLFDSPGRVSASALAAECGTPDFDAVVQRLAQSGRTLCWVDLSTEDIASVGLRAVKVMVSRMQPLYFGNPECYAPLDERRLLELAAYWNVTPPAHYHMAPHPFP